MLIVSCDTKGPVGIVCDTAVELLSFSLSVLITFTEFKCK